MAQGLGELRNLNADTSNLDNQELDVLGASSEPQASSVEFSLPPVDTGIVAWLFLAACWGVEALTFGEILTMTKIYSQGLLNRKQALASRLVFSKTSTVIMLHSLALVASPLLALLQRCGKKLYYN